MQNSRKRMVTRSMICLTVAIVSVCLCVILVFRQNRQDEADLWKSVSVSDAAVTEQAGAAVFVSESSLVLGKGLTHSVTATAASALSWRSTDESVAVVENDGAVTGVGTGNCEIIAQDAAGQSAKCAVEVKKVCYLTFDDGPNRNTEAILEALRENDVKATFFVVSTTYLKMIPEIREQGHVVAMHTHSHDYAICYKTEYSYLYGLEILSDTLEGYMGTRPNLIRFPGGTNNSQSDPLLMRRVVNGAHDLGYRIFDWTATAGDTSTKSASANFSFQKVKETCTEDEEIILMHNKSFNAAALRKIIPYLRENGYIFETLDHYPEDSYVFTPLYSNSHADVPSTAVKVSRQSAALKVGGHVTLRASMTPSGSTDYVRWVSSDPSVAAVSANGSVTGVAPGTAEISAVTTSGQSSVCAVTVS